MGHLFPNWQKFSADAVADMQQWLKGTAHAADSNEHGVCMAM
jgi:hypothetical protein